MNEHAMNSTQLKAVSKITLPPGIGYVVCKECGGHLRFEIIDFPEVRKEIQIEVCSVCGKSNEEIETIKDESFNQGYNKALSDGADALNNLERLE